MLRHKDIPSDQQGELFRIADAMQRADREAERESASAADAAEELGVSPEYLERAAAELHARRLERIQRNRIRNRWIAVGVVVVAVGVLWSALGGAGRSSRAPRPAAVVSQSIPLDSAFVRPGSQGIRLTPAAGAATIEIDRTGTAGAKGAFANVAFPLPASMPRRMVEATVRGEGVGQLRVDIEDGEVRWKGANASLSAPSTKVSFDSSRMVRQVRRGGKWRNALWLPPDSAKEIVFKFGDTVNPEGSRGTVVLERVEVR